MTHALKDIYNMTHAFLIYESAYNINHIPVILVMLAI